MKPFENPTTKGVEKPVSKEAAKKAAAEKEAAEKEMAEWHIRVLKLEKEKKRLQGELAGVEADIAHLEGMKRKGAKIEEADRYLQSK